MPAPSDPKPNPIIQPSTSSDMISKGCGWGLVIAVVLIGLTVLLTNQPEQRASKQGSVNAETPAAVSLTVAEQRQLEVRNGSKIKDMKAAMETLGAGDYEARLTFWKEIAALAPANKAYAEEVRKAQMQVQRHTYERPEDGASIEVLRPRKEGLGSVLVIDAAIRNDSLSHLKDFQIVCESKGASGTTTDVKRRVLYEIVEARTSRTFRNINMGLINNQAANATCRLEGAVVA